MRADGEAGEVTVGEPGDRDGAGQDGKRDGSDSIGLANQRIQQAIEALPEYDDGAFWAVVSVRGEVLPPEVLVHITRSFRLRGSMADVERATDLLIARAYPIASGIVRRTLLSRPQDHEDAVRDTFASMWEQVASGGDFWERNFIGALHAACISACRRYLAKKRADIPFAQFDGVAAGTDGGSDMPSFEGRLRDDGGEREHDAVVGRLTYERALAVLDPPLREVARLIAEGELTQRQIAARLGCTEKTVYNRLGKVRERLTAYFEESYG